MNATILIIDDTPDIIKMIRQVLLAENYQTLIATSGDRGIEIAIKEKPDLILLDIMMPGKDGYETCKVLKSNKSIRQVPVIFISALDGTFDKVKAFNSGGVDYIPKPIQEEELLARIKTHLLNAKYEKVLSTLNNKLVQKNTELKITLKKLEEAQEQLVHSEKMASLGVLTAGIAHEINNPVTYVFAGINSLRENYDDLESIISKYEDVESYLPEEVKNNLEEQKKKLYYAKLQEIVPKTIHDIYIGAERITEIVEGLGLFLHKNQKQTKQADINKIIDTALLLLIGKYKERITIEKDYGAGLEKVNCYPGELNQVLVNIIGNAIDASAVNGKVVIESKKSKDNSEIIIIVKDFGIGITETAIKKIFDPFYTTKDVGLGTGLGLYLSYEIIKKHNGTINVKSKKGEGSEFIIKIPSSLK